MNTTSPSPPRARVKSREPLCHSQLFFGLYSLSDTMKQVYGHCNTVNSEDLGLKRPLKAFSILGTDTRLTLGKHKYLWVAMG